MPFYDYKCQNTACNCILVDVDRKMSEPLGYYTCPKCQGKMNQVLGRASIVFKGSGFYQTDYQKKSTSSPDKEPTSGTSKEGK